MKRALFVLVSVAATTFAQRPPVILIDGYHLTCSSDNLTSTHDFGELQPRLEAEGVQVSFFGNCAFPNKPSLEDLGNALGDAINKLNVPQVDIVSHSMGGLIVRCYLSGKQNTPGVFTPPLDPKVRKWVSNGTPNFGALLNFSSLLPFQLGTYLPDAQSREMVPGTQFVFDLATWNQNHDDLRGVDTIGMVGNAGGFGPLQGGSDGTVAITSASMSFTEPDERTRVLPYCHGAGDLTTILGLGCSAPPLARIQSDNPLSWQIIDSFLAGTDAWRAVGHSPSQDKYLSQYGGIIKQPRDSMDQPNGAITDQNFVTTPPLPGGYVAVIDKAGPQIALVAPAAARLPMLSLAPGMLASIYGNSLAGSTVTVNGQSLVLNYTSDHQINVLLPDNISGLQKLTVSNSTGRATVNILIERAAPAIFTMNGSGTGTAAAIRTGNYVSLYLTGLGTDTKPTVLVNGVQMPVTYAGPAPGFPGVNQVNVQLPSATASGSVVVLSGTRASNVVTLPAS